MSKKNSDGMFDVLGQTVEISSKELGDAIANQSISEQKRQANTLENINHTLEHLVKLLKPWAERERRKNLIEQDPDYLEAVIKQVQQDRKARKPKTKYYKPTGSLKKRKL